MRLQNLADVHSTRNTKRIQQYVQRGTVLKERHILFRHNLGNNPFVPVPPSHLVTDRQGPLNRHVNLNHLQNTIWKLIAVFHSLNFALLVLLDFSDVDPELVHDLLHTFPHRGRLDPLDIEVLHLLVDNLVVLTGADFLTRGGVNDSNLKLFAYSLYHSPEYHAFFGPHLILILFHLGR